MNTNIYTHMEVVMNLLDTLVVKSVQSTLGPADGDLYMQLCNTTEAWAKVLESSFHANLPNQLGDSNANKEGNPQPESDRPDNPVN